VARQHHVCADRKRLAPPRGACETQSAELPHRGPGTAALSYDFAGDARYPVRYGSGGSWADAGTAGVDGRLWTRHRLGPLRPSRCAVPWDAPGRGGGAVREQTTGHR